MGIWWEPGRSIPTMSSSSAVFAMWRGSTVMVEEAVLSNILNLGSRQRLRMGKRKGDWPAETQGRIYNDISILVVSLIVRVENNKGGQNVGGQQREENQGSALGHLRNTFVSFSVEQQVIRAELRWVLKMVEPDFSFNSAENMVKLLCLRDKDSKDLNDMQEQLARQMGKKPKNS